MAEAENKPSKPAYELRGLNFQSYASVGVSLWYGVNKSYDILTDPDHVLDYRMVDLGSDEGYAVNGKLRTAAAKPKTPKPFYCSDLDGLQILRMTYDDYLLTQDIAGRTPVVQNKKTVLAMQESAALIKNAGFMPDILCTKKLILPNFGLSADDLEDPDILKDQLQAYYNSFTPDYAALKEYWGQKAARKLDKFENIINFPVQFMAYREPVDGVKYRISVIEPFDLGKIAVVNDYQETCRTLLALERAYLQPAPHQPAGEQYWAQHVSRWQHQSEGARILSYNDVKPYRPEDAPAESRFSKILRDPGRPLLPN